MPQHKKNKKFTFGCSATFSTRKNHNLLIEAFAYVYKNRKDVQLLIHGRYGDSNPLKKLIRTLNLKNVEIIETSLSIESYVKFISSLDCYILISKGEGFSITPRQALAAGIPCILSNNTAHKTICKAGFAYPVSSNIIERAYCDSENKWVGYDFNCKLSDVMNSLRTVKNNYDVYLKNSEKAKRWVRNYCIENLQDKYLTLIKPKKVILAGHNEIKDGCIITNSQALYKKYNDLLT